MKNEILSASKAESRKASNIYNSTNDIELKPVKSSIIKFEKERSKSRDEKTRAYD